MNEEKTPKIFVDGMSFDRPSDKAPAWIKGKISINTKSFAKWFKRYGTREWLNIDLKLSDRTGKLYLELNTYVPNKDQEKIPNVPYKEEWDDKEVKIEDIPF